MTGDFEYIGEMYKTNSGLVKKAFEGIPAEQWLLKPGDSSNHLMWVAGHLIWARGNILKTLSADGAPPWAPQFARGSTSEDAGKYPHVDEVRNAWSDLSDRLAVRLAEAPAEVLAKPHDKPTYDGKVSGYLAFLAFHETYHVGQISYLRKWLGHGQLVG